MDQEQRYVLRSGACLIAGRHAGLPAYAGPFWGAPLSFPTAQAADAWADEKLPTTAATVEPLEDGQVHRPLETAGGERT